MANTTTGIGFGGLLCIVLIVLKVMDQIEMNWFLVLTSWFWAPLLIILAFLAIVAITVGLFLLLIVSLQWALDKWS